MLMLLPVRVIPDYGHATYTRQTAAPHPIRGWRPVAARPALLGRGGQLELLDDLLLRVRADDLLRLGSVLEQDHRRDRQHLVLRIRDLVLVDVELDDLQVVLGGDLLEHRTDDTARA